MPVPPGPDAGTCRPRCPGVLGNPLSGRFVRSREAVRSAARSLPGGLYREGCTPGEIGQALRELLTAGADIIIVLGGDGTLQAVLDPVFGMANPRPPLAIVPCGSTNMAALDLGGGRSPLRALGDLRQQLRTNGDLRLVARPVLRVSRETSPPLHGMFFGAGIITAGVRYFRERVRGGGFTGEGASALAVLRMLFRLMQGAGSADFAEVRARVSEEGGPVMDSSFLLLLASTLDRLLLGSRPYWGRETAPIHYTAVQHRPARLWRSLPRIIRGRGEQLDERSYRSRNLRTIELDLGADFVLDGEIHSASGRTLRIDSAGPVLFAVP